MKRTGIPLTQLVGRSSEVAVQPASVITPAPAPVNTRKARSRAAKPTPEVASRVNDSRQNQRPSSIAKPMRDSLSQLNVQIPLALHRRVKVKAMLEGKNLGALVEELLEEWVTASTA